MIDYVDGLHLGQEDIREFSLDLKEATSTIRGLIKGKILGLSTHNIAEVEEANYLDLDYIGLGAYRITHQREMLKFLGIDYWR